MQQKRPTEISFTISDRLINPQPLKREILTLVGPSGRSALGTIIVRLRCVTGRSEPGNWEVKSTPFHSRDLQVVTDVLRLVVTSEGLTDVYSLVKAWADARNGRKLKVKVGELEVEATQVKDEEVLRIFKLLDENAGGPPE